MMKDPPSGDFWHHLEIVPFPYPKYLATSETVRPRRTISTAFARSLGILGLVVYAICGNGYSG